MKKIFAVVVVALASFGASANNVVINAGIIPSTPSAPFSDVITHDFGAFFDTINFSITESSLHSSANPLTLSLGGTTVYDISGLTYSLFNNSHPGETVYFGTFNGNNVTNVVDLMAAGSYHLDITGVADGKAGGLYGVALVTSPAPEPETYAMLAAGLGLLGFVARRKRA